LKVLLVNPWPGDVFPPPSLGYLQAVIKTMPGVQVVAKDFAPAKADNERYDLVAVSYHSFSVQNARRIREHFSGMRLICGGHHPSALPQQMLDIGYDQVVIGEGEHAIRQVLAGDTSPLVQGQEIDVETLPPPDYTGFGGNWFMGLPVISSRGCPFDCTFCGSSLFWHRRWRMRSAASVLDEVYRLPVKSFMFEDDNFTNDRRRVYEICKGLEGRGYSWQCASRAETLQDADLCMQLRRAGCHTVWTGIETLSQPSLDRNCKRTTVAKMLHGIDVAHLHGLETMCQFIIGLPDDTEADIAETVRNIKRSRIHRRGTNILWILPATAVHTKALQQGFNNDVYLASGAPYYTYEQDMNTLQRWSNLITNAK
jgi:anaerobic magnesium-protoporphyrin IX monomethyl ester cyclase